MDLVIRVDQSLISEDLHHLELGSDGAFKIDLQQFESPTLQQAARFWSNMDEFVLTAHANMDKVIGTKHSDDDKNKVLKWEFIPNTRIDTSKLDGSEL
ncbi:MAG: hypothetical protein IPJ39_06055 [Saprospiraceae bacterium]|nr:hypothetical protein [Saprospiraceae bacterium]